MVLDASEASVIDVQKRLRIRELSRYYCVASSALEDLELSETQQSDVTGIQSPPTESAKAWPLKNDPQLIALAQLAALRTNTDRSFISIIDDQTQYIVAEATRSVSIYDHNSHEPGDGLILGAQAIPITSGVCPRTLDAFLGDTVLLKRPENVADRNHVLIKDLREEGLTCNQPTICQLPPVLRYYLEVPLRTDLGILLGSICVVDSAARNPGPKDVDHLTEVSKLVVEHFEYVRMKTDHQRAQRLAQGVSHFVQGQSSLSTWSRQTKGQASIPDVQAPSEAVSSGPLSSDRLIRGLATVQAQASPLSGDTSSAASTGQSPRLTSKAPKSSTSTNPSSVSGDDPLLSNNGRPTSTNEIEIDSQPTTSGQRLPQIATSSPTQVRQAFSRASNLIRESMELDVTCFLELPQNARSHHARRNQQKTVSQQTEKELTLDSSESSYDSSTDTSLKDATSGLESQMENAESTYCHRLGFSTSSNSSVANSAVTQRYLTIPAKLLNRLAHKYPVGHIFHFDEYGIVGSSGDEYLSDLGSRTERKRSVRDKLFSYFETARSMIFLPLYDNEKQHVYAAFLGWTTDPGRALQRHEIVYVSAFADSLMCEVMRLNVLALDQAKSDFISSISHELRSPLHGILAACQLLSESEQYPHQEEFITMVDTCAHTLLDTMDHVLDYAKINRFTEQQKSRRSAPRSKHRKKSPPQGQAYSLVSEVDIVSIVEDTVLSMAASRQQSVSKTSVINCNSGTVLDAAQAKIQPNGSPIPIILNVPPHTNWLFNTEPGSWRRIVMNLVGNSIKYTQRGHISVDLQCYDNPKKNASQAYIVELKVSDTGQGISEEYLKHRLYTPFAQENNLSVGTGLGLSLVNNIVSTLNGEIRVQSEIDTGTQIIVRIPLNKSNANRSKEVKDTAAGVLANHSLAFVGFDDHPPLSESATGIMSPRSTALLALKTSMAETATGWFGLRLLHDEPDIYVIEESFLAAHLEQFDVPKNKLLVIGLDGRSKRTVSKIRRAECSYMLPPIGPQRMEHALQLLLSSKTVNGEKHIADHNRQPVQKQSAVSRESPAVNQPLTGMTNGYNSPGRSASPVNAMQSRDDRRSWSVGHKRSDSVKLLRAKTTDSVPKVVPVGTSNNKKRYVLLVDDNDINLRILVACVKRLNNIDYLTATNGKEALEIFKKTIENGETVPVIFTDVSMPVMDGMESARRIRAYESSKDLYGASSSKIVAITGLGSSEAREDIEGCGFDLYLRKPVSLQVVRKILADSGIVEWT